MNQLDQIAGLGSIALIREVVKICDFKRGAWKVITALVAGVVFNGALAVVLGNNWQVAVAFGIVAGFLSNLYNDYKTT